MIRRVISYPAICFVVMVAITLTVCDLAVRHLPDGTSRSWHALPAIPALDGLCRWDTGWYRSIAHSGYWFDRDRQSPVAFFPFFPLLMRLLAPVVGDYNLAGIAIALIAGFGFVVLFYEWTAERSGDRAARVALWALLLFPFSIYLFGAVYSDALFAVTALAAFMLLEKNRPWMSGLIGAAATATRPVGLALVVGLLIRAAERRGVFDATVAPDVRLKRFPASDAAVLLSLGGVVGYSAFLWMRFGDPLAWSHAAAAPGWYVTSEPATWLKVVFFRDLWHWRWDVSNIVRLVHALLTPLAYAMIPAIWRRFGVGYAVYTFVVVGIPAITTPDFFGMGRYLLPAFPLFAAFGEALQGRPYLSRAVLAAAFVCQVAVTALFAAWYPVS